MHYWSSNKTFTIDYYFLLIRWRCETLRPCFRLLGDTWTVLFQWFNVLTKNWKQTLVLVSFSNSENTESIWEFFFLKLKRIFTVYNLSLEDRYFGWFTGYFIMNLNWFCKPSDRYRWCIKLMSVDGIGRDIRNKIIEVFEFERQISQVKH